jgi:hypothetical protein
MAGKCEWWTVVPWGSWYGEDLLVDYHFSNPNILTCCKRTAREEGLPARS